MQNNKIIQLAFLGLMLLFSMWAVSALLEVRETTRNVLLGVGFFMLLILTMWRKMPFDAKLLLIIISGYAIGGKGFAYVSPFEPIYIGEICIALCMCGLVMRLNRAGLMDSKLHKLIWIYLIYGGVHLVVDYSEYRILALRDSSMVYYTLYFVVSYSLLQEARIHHAFERIIKIAMMLSVVSMAYSKLGGPSFPGMHPHIDAYIPLNIAAVLYFLVKGSESKNMFYIGFALLIVFTAATIKTSGLVALFAVLAGAIIYGRLKGLLAPTMIIVFISLLVLMVTAFFIPDLIIETLGSGETAETFGIDGGEFVGFSGTTSWRLDWWSIVWTDTMNMAPFWGQGFGADITGPFLEAWLGPAYADPTGYARFPHCVMFTNVGRLGLIGLALFTILFIAIGLLAIKFARRYFVSEERRDADLIVFGVVVAGMVNGLLQATYEIPHGAITHWVCLGYMAVRYYRPEACTNSETD